MNNNYVFNYIWLYIYGYSSDPLTLGLIGRDGGLSTLCQRVLKTFLGPGYLHSENGVVWYIYIDR